MMKTVVLTVVLLSVFYIGITQSKNSVGEEPINDRIKRHYGHYGSRPTYGGYQTVGSYQQQSNYTNQRPQSSHEGEYVSNQQPNYSYRFGNMRSSSYQQRGQNVYQPGASSYQQYHHGIIHS